MKLSALPAIAGASLFMFAFSTHAALVQVDIDLSNPGLEGVYDDVLNITWLADANLAASNTFGVTGINTSGTMSWYTADDDPGSFIEAMNADGGTGYLGVNTWRQASASGTCSGQYGCGNVAADTDDELGYHYYQNFGAVDNGGMTNGSNTTNLAMFSNIQDSVYWTGTETSPGSSSAFLFGTGNGFQYTLDKGSVIYVWAVAPGNVAANAVPVPAAMWLFGSALMGLAGLARRR